MNWYSPEGVMLRATVRSAGHLARLQGRSICSNPYLDMHWDLTYARHWINGWCLV